MLKREKKQQKTLAEKVAETILHSDKSGSEFDSKDELTTARVIEYDEDEYEIPQAGSTEFRKRNVKLLSEQNAKYKGEIAFRKDFESDLSEEEDHNEKSESSEDEAALEDVKGKNNRYQKMAKAAKIEQVFESEDDDSVNSEVSAEDENEVSKEDDFDDSELNTENEAEETEVISKVNHEAELQKGYCVQNQLRIWERLLELRINLQKLLNKTNQLPSAQELKDLEKNNIEYYDIKKRTCNQTFTLLQNLLSLKKNLCSQFSELANATKPSLKRTSPFAEHNSEEPPLKKVSQHIEEGFEQFRPYRNDILLKWDDRTKLLQPKTDSKKKTFNEEYDIIKKIENALINKSLLIEKSQQLKNVTQNETTEENYRNPNIYDDSDFYHQQLRELIEYKANTTSNMSEVTKQFLELQKLRQKMKKKVDTRATKGRKLRYIVHNKLINFMAPHDNTTWTAESIDELSKSLFA